MIEVLAQTPVDGAINAGREIATNVFWLVVVVIGISLIFAVKKGLVVASGLLILALVVGGAIVVAPEQMIGGVSRWFAGLFG